MRNFLNIVNIFRWNFGSVLMRLSRISIEVFTNILLGLKENFEKILENFRVYFAEIIFRISEENFEKVLCNRKNFKTISKKFWLNLENNEEIFGKSKDSLQKLWNDYENLWNVRGSLEKFWKHYEELWGKLWKNEK